MIEERGEEVVKSALGEEVKEGEVEMEAEVVGWEEGLSCCEGEGKNEHG